MRFSSGFEAAALLDLETGGQRQQSLSHALGSEPIRQFYAGLRPAVRVGLEASGYSLWLEELSCEWAIRRASARRLVGDKAYDSDPLREEYGIEMIAPNRRNRSRSQDGPKLRPYRRRWKVERLFARIAVMNLANWPALQPIAASTAGRCRLFSLSTSHPTSTVISTEGALFAATGGDPDLALVL